MQDAKPNSPKNRFLANPEKAQAHRNLVDSKIVRDSIDVALTEMVWRMTSSSPVQAADAFNQIQGAKLFIQIWSKLGDASQETPRRTHDLNYTDTPAPAPGTKQIHTRTNPA
jgi:hypothetical protein